MKMMMMRATMSPNQRSGDAIRASRGMQSTLDAPFEDDKKDQCDPIEINAWSDPEYSARDYI
jgi:hypothetical protein